MSEQRESALSVKALEEALLVVFENNFDADTKICLVTLMKLLDNVLHKPGNPKVRTIRLSNTAFHEKVGCRKGGIEFLEACGFQRQTAQAPILSDTPGEETLVLENEKQSHLITARRLLMTRAIQDLGIKSEELPQYRQPPTENASGQATSTTGGSFNLYAGHRFDAKSAAVGANLGPDSNYVSPTETQLQRLQKQQAEMESKFQNLQNREWIATMPGQSLPTSTSSSSNTPEQPSDSTLLAARMKQQQEQQRQREHGTLTTKAMRDLEQLKKKKVYSHVILTIQFADGCKLLGKFLPKETIQVVKQEIQQVCLDITSREFDLYVAPPRRLLDKKNSLQQEGLVPAAKIFVSWKVASAPDKNAAPGSYLQSHLFSQTSASLFPSAQPVVGATAESSKPADNKKPASKKKKSNREESLLKRMMGK